MTVRVGINGFGRIGRSFYRAPRVAAELARLLDELGFPPTVHHRDLDRE